MKQTTEDYYRQWHEEEQEEKWTDDKLKSQNAHRLRFFLYLFTFVMVLLILLSVAKSNKEGAGGVVNVEATQPMIIGANGVEILPRNDAQLLGYQPF